MYNVTIFKLSFINGTFRDLKADQVTVDRPLHPLLTQLYISNAMNEHEKEVGNERAMLNSYKRKSTPKRSCDSTFIQVIGN